ncbi:Protein DSF2 [Tolypocladium capitatum]|uniref:Protein DSF2 n=1 Tax=Tolypocladium capitatum TaxID=45235 RepID=A0A2K3QGD5_9HYPO|nr:Protein DSF2 [Tolypocladium capitatum]
MANRPSLLDLRSNSSQSANWTSSSRSLRSPRMHIAGEVPPELSPLDAFALQSRLLAKQLQESNKEGNRVSRLPPLTMESPLIQQGRSDYFRSMSHDSASELGDSPNHESSGLGLRRTEVEEAFAPEERPRSMHPRMSQVPPTPDAAAPAPAKPSHHARDLSRGRQLNPVEEQRHLFGVRQERSPSPMHSGTHSHSQSDKLPEPSPARKDNPLPLTSSQHSVSATSSPEKSKQESFDELGLAPPRALFPKRSSSIISSPTPGDEETTSTMSGSFHSLPMRKLSSGSVAFANAMSSPALGSFQRSASVASDSSALPRPSFNFSRPLSRAGTPGLEMSTRQASSDSQPSFILADESAHTPVSMHSEGFMDQQNDDGRSAAPSYIYSKFALPRGKTIQRSEPSGNQSQAPPPGEQPMVPPTNVRQLSSGAPPSPPTRPSSSSARTVPDDAVSMVSSMTRPSMDTSKRSTESSRLGVTSNSSPKPSRPSTDTGRRSEDVPRGRTLTSPLHDATARGSTPASVGTSDSASTIRPPPASRSFAPSASEMSAEEHLAKGIECHERGSLNESTYHLRHAARQNHPTAMLLYALACRHGWGMRANQREGVEWLRKAAEYAGIEIADVEDQVKEGRRPANFLETKTRKAQFALSIYELGVSHMNGWGIEQDKALALRCFEIAGTWGDVDALAEAGFCYAQGIGCKKDLKKSAKFYRMAEAKGMSMIGNSWIHKTKYNDDGNDKDKNKTKARSKSRTRTMFGRKSGS